VFTQLASLAPVPLIVQDADESDAGTRAHRPAALERRGEQAVSTE
jgi:hypothetical protein